MRPAADAKGVVLRLCLASEMPEVKGDAGRLQQVLWNLLTNAVKFTSDGGTVTVSTVATDRRVQLIVEDTGQGIAPLFLPHLFDRFYRIDRARSDGGVGLGLSICLSIVRAAGGEIALNSTPGQGTTVEFTLPEHVQNMGIQGLTDPSAPFFLNENAPQPEPPRNEVWGIPWKSTIPFNPRRTSSRPGLPTISPMNKRRIMADG